MLSPTIILIYRVLHPSDISSELFLLTVSDMGIRFIKLETFCKRDLRKLCLASSHKIDEFKAAKPNKILISIGRLVFKHED
tara:strand:- start:4610 stop:4852 length:243 start_codon:yes stop_codon:yes gene_type:complete